MSKKTINQKIMEKIYSQIAKQGEPKIYYPKDIKNAIILTIQVMRNKLTKNKKEVSGA